MDINCNLLCITVCWISISPHMLVMVIKFKIKKKNKHHVRITAVLHCTKIFTLRKLQVLLEKIRPYFRTVVSGSDVTPTSNVRASAMLLFENCEQRCWTDLPRIYCSTKFRAHRSDGFNVEVLWYTGLYTLLVDGPWLKQTSCLSTVQEAGNICIAFCYCCTHSPVFSCIGKCKA